MYCQYLPGCLVHIRHSKYICLKVLELDSRPAERQDSTWVNQILVTEARTWAWYLRPFTTGLYTSHSPAFQDSNLLSHFPPSQSHFFFPGSTKSNLLPKATLGSISLTLTREEIQSGNPNPVTIQGREAAAGYLLSSEWAKPCAKRCPDGTSFKACNQPQSRSPSYGCRNGSREGLAACLRDPKPVLYTVTPKSTQEGRQAGGWQVAATPGT